MLKLTRVLLGICCLLWAAVQSILQPAWAGKNDGYVVAHFISSLHWLEPIQLSRVLRPGEIRKKQTLYGAGRKLKDEQLIALDLTAAGIDAQRHKFAFRDSRFLAQELEPGEYILHLNKTLGTEDTDKHKLRFKVERQKITNLGTLIISAEKLHIGGLTDGHTLRSCTHQIACRLLATLKALSQPNTLPFDKENITEFGIPAGLPYSKDTKFRDSLAKVIPEPTTLANAQKNLLDLSQPKLLVDKKIIVGGMLGQVYVRSPTGQWQTYDTGTLNAITAVHIMPNNTMVAGGESGWLVASSDEGKTWQHLPGKLPWGLILAVEADADGYLYVAVRQLDTLHVFRRKDILTGEWESRASRVAKHQLTKLQAFFGDVPEDALNSGVYLGRYQNKLFFHFNTTIISYTLGSQGFMKLQPPKPVVIARLGLTGNIMTFAKNNIYDALEHPWYLFNSETKHWEKSPFSMKYRPNTSNLPLFGVPMVWMPVPLKPNVIMAYPDMSMQWLGGFLSLYEMSYDNGKNWNRARRHLPEVARNVFPLTEDLHLAFGPEYIAVSQDKGVTWQVEKHVKWP